MNTTPSLRVKPFPISHSSSSTSVWDRDSSRNTQSIQALTLLISWTHHKVLMWITDLLSNLRSLKDVSTSSLCLTLSHRVLWSQLISMLLRTHLSFLRMLFSTSLTLFATIITTGQIQSRFLHPACWLIRLLFIAARSETFHRMLTCTSFPSTSESFHN